MKFLSLILTVLAGSLLLTSDAKADGAKYYERTANYNIKVTVWTDLPGYGGGSAIDVFDSGNIGEKSVNSENRDELQGILWWQVVAPDIDGLLKRLPIRDIQGAPKSQICDFYRGQFGTRIWITQQVSGTYQDYKHSTILTRGGPVSVRRMLSDADATGTFGGIVALRSVTCSTVE